MGLEPIKAICSDLPKGLELDTLRGIGSENRVIPHAKCWMKRFKSAGQAQRFLSIFSFATHHVLLTSKAY